jgi:diguanylate cyclase (GGDEF)-like protein
VPDGFSFLRDGGPLKPSRTIPLLLVSAVGALAFTCAGGLVVYTNTQHLNGTRSWLEHSHTVLTTLQSESQQLDRVGYTMRLYQESGDPDDIRFAQATAAAMEVRIASLQKLVEDNPSQAHRSLELAAAGQALSESLEKAKTSRTVPEREIRETQSAISATQQEERNLLEQRSEESRRSTVRSLLFEIGFLGFSLIVIMLLFGFLVQDALWRRTSDKALASTIQTLERRSEEAILLKSARDELQLCPTSLDAQMCAIRHLQELVPGSSGAILAINNSRDMLEITASWNDPEALSDGIALDTCCGLRTGRSRWRRPGQSEINCTHFSGVPPQNYLCTPLAALGETLGFVHLACPTKEIADFACSRNSLIEEMVELASMSIAGLNLRTKLENESIRDPLTGLFNRRFMEVALERELHRAQRRNATLAVVMLDVDHFKMLNDSFGHDAGDAVLCEVAESLKQSVRTEDVICRYGGEEFVIILPEISEPFALERADKIRRAINSLNVQFKGQSVRRISISVGLAMYPDHANNGDDLIRLADAALYEAKHAGRNQVQLAVGTLAI